MLAQALALVDQVDAASSKPMVLYGKSLGSGVATYAAAHRPAAGLVLHAPYPSLVAVGQAAYPWAPVGLLLRHPMPAQDWAAAVACPVLALHGEDDTLIPIALGRQQALRFRRVDFVALPGLGHNDLGAEPNGPYWRHVRSFLRRVLALATPRPLG